MFFYCVMTFALVSVVCSGVDDNETIKVYRNGAADPDGNQPGDLYVTIKVFVSSTIVLYDCYKLAMCMLNHRIPSQVREDPVFRREKADIHVDAVLNVSQVIISSGK